jgi:hypothetical protein
LGNNELEITLKKAAVGYLKAISLYLPGMTVENHKKPESENSGVSDENRKNASQNFCS